MILLKRFIKLGNLLTIAIKFGFFFVAHKTQPEYIWRPNPFVEPIDLIYKELQKG